MSSSPPSATARLHVQQMIDIVMGAIDAWLSLDVRRATSSYSTVPSGGGSTMLKSIIACERAAFRAIQEGCLIGAGVMIVGSLIFSAVGIAAVPRRLAGDRQGPAEPRLHGAVRALDAVLVDEGSALEGPDGDRGRHPRRAGGDRLPVGVI